MIATNKPRIMVNVGLILVALLTLPETARNYGISNERPACTRSQDTLSKATSGQDEQATYKIGQSKRISSEPGEIYLILSLSPESFTRDQMVELAKRLNKDFHEEQKLSADIVDDEKLARTIIPAGDSYSVLVARQRGEYYLDRIKGYEYISFSTKRGRPANEIVVNLGRNTPKWLKRRRRGSKA